MVKMLNGWTDHAVYKIIAPLIPVILIGGWAWFSGVGSDLREMKSKMSDLCSNVDKIELSANKLTEAVYDLRINRAETNQRLLSIEKRLERRGGH